MNYKGIKDVKHYCIFCGKEIQFRGYSNKYMFCDINCRTNYILQKRKQHDEKLFEQGELKYRKRIYEILVKLFGNKCAICGITEWNKQPIRLWVDHIDGNPANNKPENFRLICPNCESQTDTSRGKNYGKGRTSMGLKPYG